VPPVPASIGWDRPWLAHVAHLRPALVAVDVRAELTRLARERKIVSGQGVPLSFVDAGDAGNTAYESHIARTGRVPTRSTLHDILNAAIWLVFPRVKAVLNARQAQCIDTAPNQASAPVQRGRQRDAATLFDESGLIIAVAQRAAHDSDVRARIAEHQWSALFRDQRLRWHRQWVPWLFGHAAMEKLVRPYVAITVRVCVVIVDDDRLHELAAVDQAAALAFEHLPAWSPEVLPPMPVLGIPGWWPANESADFYDDATVFRPRRTRAARY
jgi:hypothetical protein